VAPERGLGGGGQLPEVDGAHGGGDLDEGGAVEEADEGELPPAVGVGPAPDVVAVARAERAVREVRVEVRAPTGEVVEGCAGVALLVGDAALAGDEALGAGSRSEGEEGEHNGE